MTTGPEVVHLEEFDTYTVPQGKTAWLREILGTGDYLINHSAVLTVDGWPREVQEMTIASQVLVNPQYRYGIPFGEGTVLENFDTMEIFNFVILDN
jgi:hypothetical protein